jgi:hypothetical protein
MIFLFLKIPLFFHFVSFFFLPFHVLISLHFTLLCIMQLHFNHFGSTMDEQVNKFAKWNKIITPNESMKDVRSLSIKRVQIFTIIAFHICFHVPWMCHLWGCRFVFLTMCYLCSFVVDMVVTIFNDLCERMVE